MHSFKNNSNNTVLLNIQFFCQWFLNIFTGCQNTFKSSWSCVRLNDRSEVCSEHQPLSFWGLEPYLSNEDGWVVSRPMRSYHFCFHPRRMELTARVKTWDSGALWTLASVLDRWVLYLLCETVPQFPCDRSRHWGRVAEANQRVPNWWATLSQK